MHSAIKRKLDDFTLPRAAKRQRQLGSKQASKTSQKNEKIIKNSHQPQPQKKLKKIPKTRKICKNEMQTSLFMGCFSFCIEKTKTVLQNIVCWRLLLSLVVFFKEQKETRQRKKFVMIILDLFIFSEFESSEIFGNNMVESYRSFWTFNLQKYENKF